MRLTHCLFFVLLSSQWISTLVLAASPPPPPVIELNGQWIMDTQGHTMLNPQTSGLVVWRDRLLTIADGSAHESQRKRLLPLQPEKAVVEPVETEFALSERVSQGCFAPYLNDAPDYEALAVDPDDDKVFVTVTEDATRSVALTEECAARYKDTGSTEYPTVLVRLALQADGRLVATHARAIQFQAQHGVGNYPNDGIEGLAFSPDRTLYLGLEKDAKGQPRIFSVQVKEGFWQSDEFAPVTDPKLNFPSFTQGNHPINGMDYYQSPQGQEYILAAARNDNELWVIDLTARQATKRIKLAFFAPTLMASDCPERELMNNASIEGVAVEDNLVWLINDPWKVNYHKNIQCESNRTRYERFSPLLFKLPVDAGWFTD